MSTKLAEAYKALQSLPEEVQDGIAFEWLQEVEHHRSGKSALTSEQAAIVKERLSRPFVYASDEDIERIVGKL
jgi:hypothetical protein